MTLTFKGRLALWHMVVVAVLLAVAAAGAQWILSRTVLGTVIDDALLSLAETEAAALLADPAVPLRIHEMAPGPPPPRSCAWTSSSRSWISRATCSPGARPSGPPASARRRGSWPACVAARSCSRRGTTSARSPSGSRRCRSRWATDAPPSRWRCPSTTPRGPAHRAVALPGAVAQHPRRRRDHRDAARAAGAATHRPHRDDRPTPRRGEPRRALAASGHPGRDRAAGGHAQRHARPDRARRGGPAALHRGRLPRAELAPVPASRRARGDPPPAAGADRVRGSAAVVPGRGGAPVAPDRRAAHPGAARRRGRARGGTRALSRSGRSSTTRCAGSRPWRSGAASR